MASIKQQADHQPVPSRHQLLYDTAFKAEQPPSFNAADKTHGKMLCLRYQQKTLDYCMLKMTCGPMACFLVYSKSCCQFISHLQWGGGGGGGGWGKSGLISAASSSQPQASLSHILKVPLTPVIFTPLRKMIQDINHRLQAPRARVLLHPTMLLRMVPMSQTCLSAASVIVVIATPIAVFSGVDFDVCNKILECFKLLIFG